MIRKKHALGPRPDGWEPVFPRDKREAFARRSCSNKKIERDDDSKKSHPALGLAVTDQREMPHRRHRAALGQADAAVFRGPIGQTPRIEQPGRAADDLFIT